MNRVKVYDSKGNYLDSFIKPQRKAFYFNGGKTEHWRYAVLSRVNLFTRRTLPKGVKPKCLGTA